MYSGCDADMWLPDLENINNFNFCVFVCFLSFIFYCIWTFSEIKPVLQIYFNTHVRISECELCDHQLVIVNKLSLLISVRGGDHLLLGFTSSEITELIDELAII